jgi:hypothetical protein
MSEENKAMVRRLVEARAVWQPRLFWLDAPGEDEWPNE